MPDSIFKMQVFLHLAGLELCGESFYTEPSTTVSDVSPSGENLSAQLSWMESVLSGSADITVVLQPSESSSALDKDTKALISADALFNAITHFTKFLDEPYTLIDCKLDRIHIGSHIYKAPDPMILSLTYEQYQGAQSALGAVQDLSQYVQQLYEQFSKQPPRNLDPSNSRNIESSKSRNIDPSNPRPLEPSISPELTSAISDLHEAQATFLSFVLLPMYNHTEEQDELDSEGNVILDKKGRPKRHTINTLRTKKFISEEAQLLIPELKDHSPEWLFPIMYQWFQSSLIAHQKNFPKLFSGKKGGASDPLVATISTLNTLMKEQGYQDQQAVLDANAIFNFQKLDALTRQAEEMERMNKKMKSKSRR